MWWSKEEDTKSSLIRNSTCLQQRVSSCDKRGMQRINIKRKGWKREGKKNRKTDDTTDDYNNGTMFNCKKSSKNSNSHNVTYHSTC